MEGGRQPTGPDGHWLEPLTVLTAVAAQTDRIRLGTYILLAYLPSEHAVEGSAELAVEYMNECFPVTVAVAGSTAPFDPENARIRS